jgi:hypothetical protein
MVRGGQKAAVAAKAGEVKGEGEESKKEEDNAERKRASVEEHLAAAAASVDAAAAHSHLQQLQEAAEQWQEYDAQQAIRQQTLTELSGFRNSLQQLQKQKTIALAAYQRQIAAKDSAARVATQVRMVKGFYCIKTSRVITADDSIFLRLYAALEVLYVAADGLSEREFREMRQQPGQSLQQWGGLVRVQAACHPRVPREEQIAIYMRLLDPKVYQYLERYQLQQDSGEHTLEDVITEAQKFVHSSMEFYSARARIGEAGASEEVARLQRLNGGGQGSAGGGASSSSGAGSGSKGVGGARGGGREQGYWHKRCILHPNSSHTNQDCKQQAGLKREAQQQAVLLATIEAEEDEDKLRQLVQCCCLASTGSSQQPKYPPPKGTNPWKPNGGRGAAAGGQQPATSAGLPLPPPTQGRCDGCGYMAGHQGLPCAYTHPWCTNPAVQVRPQSAQLRAKHEAALQQMKEAGVSWGQLFPQWLQQYKQQLDPGLVRRLERVGQQQQGAATVTVVETELLPGFEGFADETPETAEEYAATLLAHGYSSAVEAGAAIDDDEQQRKALWYEQYMRIGTPEGPEMAELATTPDYMFKPAYIAACREAHEKLHCPKEVAVVVPAGTPSPDSVVDTAAVAAPAAGSEVTGDVTEVTKSHINHQVLALPHSFLQLPDLVQGQPGATADAQAVQQDQQQQGIREPAQQKRGAGGSLDEEGCTATAAAESATAAAYQAGLEELRTCIQRVEGELLQQRQQQEKQQQHLLQISQLLASRVATPSGQAEQQHEAAAHGMLACGRQQEWQGLLEELDAAFPQLTAGTQGKGKQLLRQLYYGIRGGRDYILDVLVNESAATGIQLYTRAGVKLLLKKLVLDTGATMMLVSKAVASRGKWRSFPSPVGLTLANNTHVAVIGMTEPALLVLAEGTPYERVVPVMALVVEGADGLFDALLDKGLMHLLGGFVHPAEGVFSYEVGQGRHGLPVRSYQQLPPLTRSYSSCSTATAATSICANAVSTPAIALQLGVDASGIFGSEQQFQPAGEDRQPEEDGVLQPVTPSPSLIADTGAAVAMIHAGLLAGQLSPTPSHSEQELSAGEPPELTDQEPSEEELSNEECVAAADTSTSSEGSTSGSSDGPGGDVSSSAAPAASEGSKGIAAGLAAAAGGDVSAADITDCLEEQCSRHGLRLLCRALSGAKAFLILCLFLVFGIVMALVGPAIHFTVVQPLLVWVAQGMVKLWQAANSTEPRRFLYLAVCLGAGGVFTGVGAGRLRRQYLSERKELRRAHRRAVVRWSARSVLLLLLVLLIGAVAVTATPDLLVGMQMLTGTISAWEFSHIHAGCFRCCSQM